MFAILLTPRPFSLFNVVLLNDDYTPMEFVVNILEVFFDMTQGTAEQVMLQVHSQGLAICGTYPKDIAETKAQQVVNFSQLQEYPLLCEVRQA